MIGVSRFQDLDVYKLAVQLRRDIVKLTSSGAVSRDQKFVTQIRNAARGGPRNVAEGFSRFAPSEFRNFLSYAKASIDETKSHIEDGRESGYFSNADCDRILTVSRRALAAISGLMRYLESPAATRAYEALRRARQTKPWKPKNSPRTPEPGSPKTSEPKNREP